MKLYLITLSTAAAFLVGCEQRNVEQASQEFNQLPSAVQKTVRAQAPNAEVADIEQKNRDGVTVYQIEFRDKQRNPAMEVAADGTLLRYEAGKAAAGAPGTVEGQAKGAAASSTANQITALPMTVQKAIQANAPRAEVVDINRKEENGRVYYEIEYAGKDRKPTLQVGEDGHIYKLPTEEAKSDKR